MRKEDAFTYWHKLVAIAKRKFATAPRLLLVVIVVGTSTSTLFLWRSLLVNNRPQTEQTIQSDVVPVKKSITANIKPSSNQLVFAGSGANVDIIRLLTKALEQTHPEIQIDIPASIGSAGAIKATADGASAVGLISRPLNEQEKKLGLTVVPYAQTAIAFAAHSSVAEDGLTSAELIKIYKGTKSHWQDGQQIIVLTRERGSSSILVLEEKLPGFKEVFAESARAKRWTTLYSSQEMNQVLAMTPYSLGIADVGTITTKRLSSIKILKFNGVSPTLENISTGKYPFFKTVAFVFRKDKLPANAKAFLNFIQSKEGKKLLRANGYLPVE